MWFKNLQIYRLPQNLSFDLETLETSLSGQPLRPCGNSEMQCTGWVPPRNGGAFVHAVNRQWLLALGVEQRLLPTSIVRRVADERAKAIEEAEGRRVGRRELRDLREATASELMPRAFVARRTIYGWVDPLNGWLVIDAASPAKAEVFLEQLRKSAEGFPAGLLKTTTSPSAAMTGWVAEGEAPSGFSIDQDIELRSAENAVIRYARHSLEGKEIGQHIADGKVVTRLGLTWNERISFLLDEKLQVKRLEFLDLIKEEAENQSDNEDERFDLDFTLMSGELAQLLADLVSALGGEVIA